MRKITVPVSVHQPSIPHNAVSQQITVGGDQRTYADVVRSATLTSRSYADMVRVGGTGCNFPSDSTKSGLVTVRNRTGQVAVITRSALDASPQRVRDALVIIPSQHPQL